MKGAGIGTAALALGGFGLTPRRANAQALTDADVRAAIGTTLADNEIQGVGTLGTVTGGSQMPFSNKHIMQYAQEIACDERNHVLFLRGALGDAAVARPQIDLDMSFTNLARAAGIIGPSDTFSPSIDDNSFLLGAFIFEDVGVTAYHGAATSITDPTYLSAAAGILAVEAYHASGVRVRLLQAGLIDPVAKISALRATLLGAADDQGIVLDGKANVVPTDDNSIAFARTPQHVLNIVYGDGAASNYLFFPNKLNGTIA